MKSESLRKKAWLVDRERRMTCEPQPLTGQRGERCEGRKKNKRQYRLVLSFKQDGLLINQVPYLAEVPFPQITGLPSS